MPYQPENFTVGWICAIETEFVVACELLDREYDRNERPRTHEQDQNSYHFGCMYEHKVVIACLPKGRYGNNSASLVASHMLLSFPAIRIGLMVGIGGGAPSPRHDIRLGDVVVSSPTPRHGGVIQYDYGKAIQNQEFDETGYLAAPPQALLSAVSYLSAQHKRKGHQITETISDMLAKNKRLINHHSRPDADYDELYSSSYTHSETCLCQSAGIAKSRPLDETSIVERKKRGEDEDDPTIHYGLIASANTLLKDALIRDQLIQKHDVLCFEMEAAGLMDNFPCIVIRGISDYADSHKRDQWQGYAAATAAAYAKELLGVISSMEVRTIQPVNENHILQTQTNPSAARYGSDSNTNSSSNLSKYASQESFEVGRQSIISDTSEVISAKQQQPEALRRSHERINESIPSREQRRSSSSVERMSDSIWHKQQHEEDNTIQTVHKSPLKQSTLVTIDEFLASKEPGLFEIDVMQSSTGLLIQQIQFLVLDKQYNSALAYCKHFLKDATPASGSERDLIEKLLIRREFSNVFFELGNMRHAAENYSMVWESFPMRDHCVQALQAGEKLAQALARLGEDKRAVNLFEYVIQIRERFLGMSHPETIATMGPLVGLYQKQRAFNKACVLYKKLWYSQYLGSGSKEEHYSIISSLKWNLQMAGLRLEANLLENSTEEYFNSIVMQEYRTR